MGYGFGDINVRAIWHRLSQLMMSVPTDERPPSFIVRLDPDPVLERLDRSVGLQTITLDPTGVEKTGQEKTELLERFMLELALAVHELAPETRFIPSRTSTPFALKEASRILGRTDVQPLSEFESRVLSAVSTWRIHSALRAEAEQVLEAFSAADLYGDAELYRREYALNFELMFPSAVTEEVQ
jgi:hypothetical protein